MQMDQSIIISRKLYDVLEYVGVSEEKRKIFWDTSMAHEINDNIHTQIWLGHDQNCYIFGSSCEGSTSKELDSDVDMLVSNNRRLVVEYIGENKHDKVFLIVKDPSTKPGYVKLQHASHRIPAATNPFEPNEFEDIDNNGQIVLKHVSISCMYDYADERNGPADTIVGLKDLDCVPAFRCLGIPSFANNWLKRKRPFDWPSEPQIHKMRSYGCFFVGVGHPKSSEKNLEWRISFSLQERMLMKSLNATQHKCYVVLKMIKNDLIQPRTQKSISSYHCKTVLFYTIEENPVSIWTPENMFNCLCLCLVKLSEWLKAENCPNFFIVDENMFERLERVKINQVYHIILDILSSGYSFIFSLTCDHVGQLMFESLSKQGYSFPYSCSITASELILESYRRRHNSNQQIKMRILKDVYHCDNASRLCGIFDAIQKFKDTIKLNEHDSGDIQIATSRFVPHLYLHAAQCKASQLSEISHKDKWNSCEDYILKAKTADLLSAKLIQATLYLKLGRLEDCEGILQECDKRLVEFVFTLCGCFDAKPYSRSIFSNEFCQGDVTPEKILGVELTGCIVFHPSELNLVCFNEALIYEMYRSVGEKIDSKDPLIDFWFDFIVIDGKVYLYYLQYLLYTLTGNTTERKFAISNMIHVLFTDRTLGHRETTLNLLGWIFMKEQMLEDAARCFENSLNVRKRHNAAKWHILLLIHTYLHC